MIKFQSGMTAIIALLLCLALTGCWSSSPIEDRNLEVGIALDTAAPSREEKKMKKKGGGYPKKELIRRTVQFELPEGNGGSAEGPTQAKNFYNLEETGDSIMEMTRETYLRTNSPAGFHLKIIIISSSLLKSFSMYELLDFFLRDNDIRLSLEVMLSTGTASDVLSRTTVPGKTPALTLKELFSNRERNSRMAEPLPLAKIIAPLKANRSFILPNVITTDHEIKVAGAGVIKGKTQKYAGFLSETEVEGLQWIKGDIPGGVLKETDPQSHKKIEYEIKSAKSKIQAIVEGDDISFHVKMISGGRIAESFKPARNDGNNKLVAYETKLVEEKVNELAQDAVAKMRKLRVDVGGFGEALHLQHPEVWKKVKDDWDNTFAKIPITYSTKINIEDYGASSMTVD
ncbi:Ger(x)C family spore germination protein [Paenibacillus sp. P96]|uniref:Ger(X)C family spore germination protein n=1 Tax=Paenibacillus zeirhizosphaerae TaxID=2987519 RepID=A0ABT9FLL8_9BACL|nr:Ger(x)C family spore germination protein [Paenibacillus sp. P96]MDP4095629.1 Ger(x)C family spore germination protein [Paenibacillus sp. P96]